MVEILVQAIGSGLSKRALIRGYGLGLAGLLACGETPTESIRFGEVCGQTGPVRLLELAPGRVLASSFRVGERRVHQTALSVVIPEGLPGYDQPEVWSTGLCGESPRLLASDVSATRYDRWPDAVVGCRLESDELVLLDPEGGPATPLLPGAGCYDTWTEYGVVVTVEDEEDEAFDSLMLQPYPEDLRDEAPPPRLLHPQVALQPPFEASSVSPFYRFQAFSDEVLAIDAADDLIRIDLATGTTTVEAAGVLAFQASYDGHYLLWQQLPYPLDALSTISPVIFQDRETGTGVALGEFAISNMGSPFIYTSRGLLDLIVDGRLRVHRLPDLELVEVPVAYDLLRVIDDRRWLLRSRRNVITIFDVVSGEETVLFTLYGTIKGASSESALVFAPDFDEPGGQGVFHDVPLDGSGPRIAAPRATTYARLLEDHQLVTTAGLDARLRGELLLVDLDTAHEQRIDDHVPVASFRHDADFGPGHVVYLVDDGVRSGVYVARLPEP